MKPKQLLITLIVAVLVLGLVFFLLDKDSKKLSAGGDNIGSPILKDLPVNNIDSISVKKGESALFSLSRSGDNWKVVSSYDYPADFAKIRNFISVLSELTVSQNVIADQSDLDRLGLGKSGDGIGTFIELSGKGGKIASLLVGKQHLRKGTTQQDIDSEWPDGRYVFVTGKNQAAVVGSPMAELDTPSSEWLDRDFISAKDMRVASLFQVEKGKWTLSRSDANGELAPSKIPEGKELDKNKMNMIANSLYTIRFADVANPALSLAETGIDKPSIFAAEMFSGKKYEVLIGAKKDTFRYVKVKVEFQPQPPVKKDENAKEEDKAKEELKAKEAVEKAKKEVEVENAKFAKWTYLIPENSLAAMLSTPDDFYKKPKAENPANPGKGKLPPGVMQFQPK